MNRKEFTKWVALVLNIPEDTAREYVMERSYNGLGHDEALAKARSSVYVENRIKED